MPEDNNISRVVVAMSGGVDSSVAAAILRQSGRDVIGIGLQLVDESTAALGSRSCCGLGDMEDARRVAENLGIPFYVLNFKEVFQKHVIDYFVDSYLVAETPNPCIPCNEVVKYQELLRAASGMEARFLATGHYARVTADPDSGRFQLRKGVDATKDQSYFLYSLSQEQLGSAIFPVGEMTKQQTRQMADRIGLKVHDKAESQDICFVDGGGYAAFIAERAAGIEPGPILDTSGAVIGKHKGLPFYTIGQRKGLGISMSQPMYVVEIDREANSITVAGPEGLECQESVLLRRMNYVSVEQPSSPLRVLAMTRYRRPEVSATLLPRGENTALIEFDAPQEPTAPGQSVVLYNGDIVVGGGIVTR